MRDSRLDLFFKGQEHQFWLQAAHPIVLILSGYNNEYIKEVGHCWLSPIAMAKVDHLRKSESIYAHHIFHSRSPSLKEAITTIFYQLLCQKKRALRDKVKRDELRAEIHHLGTLVETNATTHKLDKSALTALGNVACRILNLFDPSQVIYIIIDRVDRCSDLEGKNDQRKALLKMLVRIAETTHTRLKMLVVCKSCQWAVDEHQDDLEQKSKETVVVHKMKQAYVDGRP